MRRLYFRIDHKSSPIDQHLSIGVGLNIRQVDPKTGQLKEDNHPLISLLRIKVEENLALQ